MSVSFISKAQSWITPTRALRQILECAGSDWAVANERQRRFREQFDRLEAAIKDVIRPDELNGLVQIGGVDLVNTFLKRKGFDIQLDSGNVGPSDIASVATLDLKVSWAKTGSMQTIYANNFPTACREQFPNGVQGAYMKGAKIFNAPKRGVIAGILPMEGRTLSCVLFETPRQHLAGTPEDLDVLAQLSCELLNPRSGIGAFEERDYEALLFPAVEADLKPSLDWFVGAKIGDATLSQALQQFKLRLDHMGAEVREAAALYAARGMPSYLTISGPMSVAFVAGTDENAITLANGIFGYDTWIPAT